MTAAGAALDAEALVRALDDDDGEVRARAAQGLAQLDDPRALAALVRTLDDFPDLEHAPYTSSTYLLAGRGAPAIAAVAPLLSAPARITRQRAFLVVLQVLEAVRGAAETTTRVTDLGDPRADGAAADQAAQRWQAWIAREFPG